MIYVKLLLTAIFWGGTFVAGRLLSDNVHPLGAALLRFVISTFILLAVLLRVEGKLVSLNLKESFIIILLGLTGVFSYNFLFFSGLRHIEAGKAALIIANNPVFISLISVAVFRESFSFFKALGIVLSVTGAMVVISDGSVLGGNGIAVGEGEVMIFGCVVSWVLYSIVGKIAMRSLSPLVSVTYSSLSGMVFLLAASFFYMDFTEVSAYTLSDWFSISYLAVFGTVIGFFWYYQGIEKIGAMKAGVFINFVPVSAILISWIAAGESVTVYLLLGGGMVIAGVCFTNFMDNILQKVKKTSDLLPDMME